MPLLLLWHQPTRRVGDYAIVDTDMLQLPVNVIMAGDVPIKASYRENDVRSPNFRMREVARAAPARRLKGDKPSFTVRTDKKGYD